MLHSVSVKTRLIVSVGANSARALVSFITGLVIARALSPAGYGELTFLLGSFIAIRSLLDMGSSSAFYTFLSRQQRGPRFYGVYFAWLSLQFFATLALVALLIPSSLFDRIWLGHDRGTVVLAFVAAFLQQQIWQAVGQIGEAMRKTVKVQLLNLAVALVYLLLIASTYAHLSVAGVLYLLIGQYAVASLIAYRLLRQPREVQSGDEASVAEIFEEYRVYCKPLVGLALAGFLYDFADKWMLQKFGGAIQQGYFQVASQFAAVSLLATTSILSVFWKEIADAWARHDHARVAYFYKRISRGLVMLATISTGLFLPWSEQIVTLLLGPAYQQAWPVLAIMLLYPIHQSMGQIGGAMLLATGRTRMHTMLSMSMMTASIPLSYFILAPSTSAGGPGLGLGAIGMACKMVGLGLVSVNLQAWLIARNSGWRFDWQFQALGIPLVLGLGYLAKWGTGLAVTAKEARIAELLAPLAATTLLYLLLVTLAISAMPWLMGIERAEMADLLRRLKQLLRPGENG